MLADPGGADFPVFESAGGSGGAGVLPVGRS